MAEFAIADVAVSQERYESVSHRTALEAITRFSHRRILGYATKADDLLTPDPRAAHPFVEASLRAFAHHHPLRFGPDEIWMLIINGVSQHINANPEALRARIVSHSGKVALEVTRDDFRADTTNPWHEVIPEFVRQIEAHAGSLAELMTPRYSTTTAIDQAAFGIALMEATQNYFTFLMSTFCGIPRVALDGTEKDWRALRERTLALEKYDLSWWLETLDPVLEQLVQSAAGNVDMDFWRSFVKQNSASGGPYVSGWINEFFPYLDAGSGPAVRNPYLGAAREGLTSSEGAALDSFGTGRARAPVEWKFLTSMISLDFLGGFVGISQRKEDGCLRPILGWAVAERNAEDADREERLRRLMDMHLSSLSDGPSDDDAGSGFS